LKDKAHYTMILTRWGNSKNINEKGHSLFCLIIIKYNNPEISGNEFCSKAVGLHYTHPEILQSICPVSVLVNLYHDSGEMIFSK